MNRAERRRLDKERRKNKVSQPVAIEDLLPNAMRALHAGEIDKADKLFAKLIALYPDEPSSLHFAGITKYQLGNYPEALQLLAKAVQVAPNYAEAHNSLGIVYLEQKNYESAHQCFTHAIELKPDYANSYVNLGSVLKELGNFDESVAAFNAALQYNPGSTEAAYKLASTYLALDEASKALEASNLCLTIDQHCQNANAYKAMALARLDKKEEWAELYNFEKLIQQVTLEVPNNFDSLESFNGQLEQDIRNHSSLSWEPLERVTHGGAVTKDMMLSPSKAIAKFEKSLRKAINQYIASINYESNHPFLNRAPSRYRLTLIASILQAKGWHPPHIHESSWLSGCYYVRVPEVVENAAADQSGWIQFGCPDYELPNSYVPETTARKPEEGTAVTFPSYFFHGTIPYAGDGERIGIAFDVHPL